MKNLLCAAIALVAIALTGCGSDSEKKSSTSPSTNATAETSPLNAPTDYLKALNKGQQSAAKTVDTVALDRAIDMFEMEHGRNPTDLNELVEKKFIPQIPPAPYGTKLVYDSVQGNVKIVPQ